MSEAGGTRQESSAVAAGGTRRESGLGTSRESGGPPGQTRREAAGPPGGTRRETGAAGGVEAPEFISVRLPEGLADRFRPTSEIPTQGAEATVIVVEDLATGEARVLKLYRRGIDLDRDAVADLITLSQSEEGRQHIVTLYEADVEASHWYEVQEYCPHRSLRDVLRQHPVDPRALATEMGQALVYLEGRLYLRDLKPENLLIRALEPFDVVVADFGLVRNAEAGSVRWTEGGTFAYMPPEAAVYRVTRAWDWWSAGMVLAEVALGRHPLAGADGQLRPAVQILDLVNRTPIDLSGIADERIRLLCRGLLVRNPDRRWRAEQVAAWMAGDEPEVPSDDDTALTTVVGSTGATSAVPAKKLRPTSTVRLGGTTYTDARELAAAFQSRWDYALAQLFQDRDAAWIAELDTFLRDRELTGAAQVLARGVLAATELPQRMASLLVEMDPHLDPVFDGLRVTPAGLADAAHAVVSGGRSGYQGQLREVRDAGVLTLWTSLPGMSRGGLAAEKVDETWQRDCRQLDDLAANVRTDSAPPPPADALEVAKARLLLCALDPKQLTRLRREIRYRRSLERSVPWWRVLADQGRTSASAAALALLFAPEARYAAEQEKRRQAEADAATRAAQPRARGVLTRQAHGPGQAPGQSPVLLAAVPVLLIGSWWLIDHFGNRMAWFIGMSSQPGEQTHPFTVENIMTVMNAGPRIVGLAIACAAVLITGAWLRGRRLTSVAARAYVAASALVQGAAGGVLAILATLNVFLGYIAFASEDKGLGQDFVPVACRTLVAAAVVALGAIYLLFASLRRLALALFGGEVIVR